MLEIKDLNVTVDGKKILKGLTLKVEMGQVLAMKTEALAEGSAA